MKLYEFFSVPSIGDHEEKKEYDTKSEREKLANDVFWYILDHDRIHKEYFFPLAKQIHEDLKSKKDIDRKKYAECLMPMVEAGCTAFYKENKMTGKIAKVFDKKIREEMCKRLAEKFIKEISKNEYQLGS